MMRTHRSILALLLLTWALLDLTQAFAQNNLQHWEFKVDGVAREALAYIPANAKEQPTPVIFVFHGHGGTAQNAARSFAMNQHWPEAISIYMQGLNTPGKLTDPEGKKPGWQKHLGDQSDRDLKFFDNVLARLNRNYEVDSKRIYATGHSNGGAFTYLLWAERGDIFAAVAPSSGFSMESLPKLKPKPAMHIAGQKDPLVKFEWQRRVIDHVRKLNHCNAQGKPWKADSILYPSEMGTPLVTLIHPGGHQFPSTAPALIAAFFKDIPK